MENVVIDKIILNDTDDVQTATKPKQGRAIPGLNYGVDMVTDKIKTGDEEKEKEFRPYAPIKRNDRGEGSDGGGQEGSDGSRRGRRDRYEGSDGGRQGSNGRYEGSDGGRQGSNGRYEEGSQGRYEGSQGRYEGSSGGRQGSQGRYEGSQGRYEGSQGRYEGSEGSQGSVKMNPRRMEPQLNSQKYEDQDTESQGSMSIYSDEDNLEEPVAKPKLTYEQIRSKKIEGLASLKRLEDQGYEAAGKKCGLTSSLEEIEEVLEKLRAQRDLDNSIKFQRDILVTFVGMVEYGCSIEDYNIFDLDLNGWSKAVYENITDYDEVFEELHYKYKTSMSIAPELKLLGMLGMSGYRYHLSRQMISKAAGTVPGFNDVMNSDPELRRRYQDTASRMAQKNGMPAGPPPMMAANRPPPPKQTRTPMNDPDDVDGLLASIKGKKSNRVPAEINLSEIDMYSNNGN